MSIGENGTYLESNGGKARNNPFFFFELFCHVYDYKSKAKEFATDSKLKS